MLLGRICIYKGVVQVWHDKSRTDFIFNHFKIIKAENNGLKIEVAAKMAEE